MQATITNVTLQGLESLQPVLHFDDIAKPLVLGPEQCDELAYITGSAVLAEWIGTRLLLVANHERSPAVIELQAADEPQVSRRPSVPRARNPALSSRIRQTLVVLLVLFLIFPARLPLGQFDAARCMV